MTLPTAELTAFRAAREDTLGLVAGVPQEQLDASPGKKRWSAGEVLDHLRLTDRAYRQDLETLIELAASGQPPLLYRSLRDFDASPFFLPKGLLPVVEPVLRAAGVVTPQSVRRRLAGSRLFPVEHPDTTTPRARRPGADLRRDLTDSLAAFEILFRTHPDLPYEDFRHRHPLLGTNDAAGLLKLMTVHDRRHQGQIRDTLAAVG